MRGVRGLVRGARRGAGGSQVTTTYRRRAYDVTAVQWDGTQGGSRKVVDLVTQAGGTAEWFPGLFSQKLDEGLRGRPIVFVKQATPRGTESMVLYAGDWICRPSSGRLFVCSSRRFQELYMAVPS